MPTPTPRRRTSRRPAPPRPVPRARRRPPRPPECQPLFRTPALQEDDEIYFDREAARKAAEFFPGHLRHVKGPLAGKPLELLPWQAELVRDVFGWKYRENGLRVTREVFLGVPKKQGKTTLAAGFGIKGLAADKEEGAEVYSAAGARKQAAIVFNIAKQMIRRSPSLAQRIGVQKHVLVYEQRMSHFEPVSAEAGLQEGLNPHFVINDEVHVWRDRELYDALKSGQVARSQPLVLNLSTAGIGQEGLCWELWNYVEQLAKGIFTDRGFYGLIYGAPKDAPWADERTWWRAMPNLGISVKLETMRDEARSARNRPASQNSFRRYRLNQWTQQAERFLDMDRWDECSGLEPGETPQAWRQKMLLRLKGRPCFVGLDLSSTTDLTALLLLFPPLLEREPWWILPWFWVPGDNLHERYLRDRVPYPTWHEQGFVESTSGDVIDFDAIQGRFLELGRAYLLRETGFDQWGAIQLEQRLTQAGFTMVKIPQSAERMGPATNFLEQLVLGRKLAHGGNPVLRWNADNLAVEKQASGGLLPSKRRSREKIDGMTALIMAVARAMFAEEERPGMVIEEFIGGSYER